MAGYIKLSRKFFDHPFWKEERTYSTAEAWLDLIRSARFEEYPEKVLVGLTMISIHRGELRASQRYLSKRWNWPLSKVNSFMRLLVDERMIERRSEHSETIINIVNYDVFNGSEKQQPEQRANAEKSEGERNPEQTKERKEREEGKEVIVIPLPLKPSKSKAGKKEIPPVADTPLLTMPFNGEEFRTLWAELVRSKKWKGKPLSALSLSLKKLSKYSEEFACVLIADAIEGQWQGVVFDGTDEKYEKWKKLKHGNSLQEAKVPGSRIWKPEELQG